MKSREATVIFLLLIVTTSVYVGYNYFIPPNPPQEEKNNIDASTEQDITPLVIATSPAIEEPNSYEEMIIDLENNGIITIIEWTGGWQGRIGLSYPDAIALAKKAKWVGIEQDSIGFVFWLDGDFWIWYKEVTQSPSGFEKVEIQSALGTLNTAGNWTIVLKLKNTGTATANLIGVFINDIEVNNYASAWVDAEWSTNMASTHAIKSGATSSIEIYIDADKAGTTLSSGTTINIKIHSAGGMDYIKLVELI